MHANSGFQQSKSGLWVPYHGPKPSDRVIDLAERMGIPRRASILNTIQGALANDSVLVTPGSGATIATHLASSKEHQVVMVADPDGHLHNSRDEFIVYYTEQTNSATREIAELFNADAAIIVRVRGVWVIPTVTAITGVAVSGALHRISAVGTTGSTTVTPRPMDTTQAALDADITARYNSTAGATSVHEYMRFFHFNEETNAGLTLVQHQNLIPSSIGNRVPEIVLRQNQGIKLQFVAGGTVGLTGALVYFTVE
jgi:hypothetical protein